MDLFYSMVDATDAAAYSRCVHAHLLAERDGDCILQVRAAHLEDILVLLGLLLELRSEAVESCRELLSLVAQADLDARRERVIRGLCHVGMVVRGDDVIAAFRLADDLECAVAEDLVHVHVDGRASAALDRINRELVEEFAVDDLISSFNQCLADLLVETARSHVRHSSGLLDAGDALNEIRVNRLARDVEVIDGTHRLNTVVNLIRYFEFTNEIMFFSHVCHVPFFSPPDFPGGA